MTDSAPASAYAGAQRSGCSIIKWMSSILSVTLRMDSTTGSPSVRLGTKWLSITSTCTASELGTDSIAVCRFAKSADKMLGMILRATARL